MAPYRYVAVDVDGTLLDDADRFDSTRLNRDVLMLKKLGVTFIIASGNSYDALSNLFQGCPAVTNFVAENGGRIITGHKELFSQPHSLDTIKLLLAIIKTLKITPDLYSLSGGTQTYLPEQFSTISVPYYPHHTYFTDLAEVHEPIYNVNVNWFKRRPSINWIQQIVQELNVNLPTINATYSGAYGIDILPNGINKATSLQKLVVDINRGKMAELVTFGDSSNDIEMLQEAGCGIAMKNASLDLLAVADQVTTFDNNQNGLLHAIESVFKLGY